MWERPGLLAVPGFTVVPGDSGVPVDVPGVLVEPGVAEPGAVDVPPVPGADPAPPACAHPVDAPRTTASAGVSKNASLFFIYKFPTSVYSSAGRVCRWQAGVLQAAAKERFRDLADRRTSRSGGGEA